MVLNLVLNALDAVEPEQGVVTVKTEYDSQSHLLIFTTTDNGKGIPEDELDDIFDAFHSNKGHGGTGLGLAVVRKVIDEHAGGITVTSSPEEGTTFTVRIPTTAQPLADSDSTHGPD